MGWSRMSGSAGQGGRSCWRLSFPASEMWDSAQGDKPWAQYCKSRQLQNFLSVKELVGMVETSAVLQQNFWICPCTELGMCPCSVSPKWPTMSIFQFCREHSWFSLWQYVFVALDKADLLLPVAGTSLWCVCFVSAPWECLEAVSPVSPFAPASDTFALFSTLQDCGLCVKSFACHCSAFPNTELPDWLFPEILVPKSLLTPLNLKQLQSFPLLC